MKTDISQASDLKSRDTGRRNKSFTQDSTKTIVVCFDEINHVYMNVKL